MMKVIMLILFFLFVIFIGPVLLIWSLNTLGITENTPLNFWTWLAGFIFNGIVSGSAVNSYNQKS